MFSFQVVISEQLVGLGQQRLLTATIQIHQAVAVYVESFRCYLLTNIDSVNCQVCSALSKHLISASINPSINRFRAY